MDKKLQNYGTFRNLPDQVECGTFEFILRERNGDFSLQIQFNAPDNTVGNFYTFERQFCRIWILQDTMCDSEVIRTAWKAAEMATLHELAEKFKFCGEMIYSPHMNVHKLVEARRQDGIDQVREPVEGDEVSKFGTPMEV